MKESNFAKISYRKPIQFQNHLRKAIIKIVNAKSKFSPVILFILFFPHLFVFFNHEEHEAAGSRNQKGYRPNLLKKRC